MSKKKTSKSLAVLPPVERAVVAIGISEEREKALIALAASTKDITSITNDDGYKQVDSARKVLKRERLEIESICEETREDAQKFTKAVIGRQKYLVGLTKPEEDRLQVLQSQRDDELERERQAAIDAEIARQADLQERIAELRGNQLLTPTSGAALIAEHISDLEAIAVDDSFEEFKEQAETAKTAGLSRLREIHAAAVTHEAERAELERLRTEAAERAAAQAEEERKAKAARDAEAARRAEQLHQQAEDAAREQAARQKIIDDNNARIAAEQKEAQEKLDAEAQRQAQAQREIERQQEELRIATLPPQPPAETPVLETLAEWTSPVSVTAMLQESRFGAEPQTAPTVPTADEIVSALVDIYGESDETVLSWLRGIDWNAEVSEAA